MSAGVVGWRLCLCILLWHLTASSLALDAVVSVEAEVETAVETEKKKHKKHKKKDDEDSGDVDFEKKKSKKKKKKHSDKEVDDADEDDKPAKKKDKKMKLKKKSKKNKKKNKKHDDDETENLSKDEDSDKHKHKKSKHNKGGDKKKEKDEEKETMKVKKKSRRFHKHKKHARRCVPKWGDCSGNNCCADADAGYTCMNVTVWFSQCRNAPPKPPIELAGFKLIRYTLDTEARGHDFFNHFKFITEDSSHGSAEYVSTMDEAVEKGVVGFDDRKAILRAGGRTGRDFKRSSFKIGTTKSWKHFLMAVKFDHVPWGCGVRPSIYTEGVGLPWPYGGQMDIMQHTNTLESFTNFKTAAKCKLKGGEVNRFKQMFDLNNAENNFDEYNCQSSFSDNGTEVGCAPNVKPLRTGKEWAGEPGIIALQRAPKFAKVFFIPQAEIPRDLVLNHPKPEYWDKFMISYYPFGPSGDMCPNADEVMGPQRIMLSLGFCGDQASKLWGTSKHCPKHGPQYNELATLAQEDINVEREPRQCRAINPTEENSPEQDCCTQFIDDADGKYKANPYLKKRAFFSISWLRVYT